ncbi:MAG: bile acid:sodium symporter family protein [Gammaproteobacteria bacterium]|nr:bile acid:sodium symporter family protein [Gammaproteobacteria bacterium]
MIIFRWIANALAPLTLIGALLAFWYPPAFLIFKHVFLWMFAATMFALGLVLQQAELRHTLREPGKLGLGVLTQYSVMPLLGAAVAWFSGLDPAIALGFVIVASAPGAMASNVIVYLAGGAVAYSIALTTLATFLSPLVTPSLVEWIGGALLPVPFWGMMRTIFLTVLLPLLLGMLLRRLLLSREQVLATAEQIAPAVAALAIVIICSYAVAANQSRIASVGLEVMAWVIAINALGYLIGWNLSRLYGFDHRHKVTLSIEIGMQNAGMGVALALAHFAPETALPGALFAAWSVLTSAGISSYLRWRNTRLS